jgi:hypothetical protein
MILEIYYRKHGKRKWEKCDLDWALHQASCFGNRSADEFINTDLQDNRYIYYPLSGFDFKKEFYGEPK